MWNVMKNILFVLIGILLASSSCKQKPYTMEVDGGISIKCRITGMEANGEDIDSIRSILTKRLQIIDPRIIPSIEYEKGDSIYKIDIPGVEDNKIRRILMHGNISIEEMYMTHEIFPYLADNPLIDQSILPHIYNPNGNNELIKKINPKRMSKIDSILSRDSVKASLPGDVVFVWGEGNDAEMPELYPIRRKQNKILINSFFEESEVEQSRYNSFYEIGIKLSKEGGKRFEMMTSANIGRQLAIILDNEVLSAPTVMSKIEGGRMMISGSYGEKEMLLINSLLHSPIIKSDIEVIRVTKINKS